MLFPLAFASAKRVGELYALSYRVSQSRAGVRCPSSSWASWQRRRTPPPPLLLSLRASLYRPYQNRAQIAMGDCNVLCRMLCPVRAVRCYLDRTAARCPRCERMFVTAGCSKKAISKNTVSFWLRKMISRAYQLSGRSLLDPPPRARATHGIAQSLLFKKNFTVAQVVKAGT